MHVPRPSALHIAHAPLSSLHRYDSHRESILRSSERYQAGGGGFEGGQRPADEEDLFQFFTSACYSGFGDGLRGFYGQWDVCLGVAGGKL